MATPSAFRRPGESGVPDPGLLQELDGGHLAALPILLDAVIKPWVSCPHWLALPGHRAQTGCNTWDVLNFGKAQAIPLCRLGPVSHLLASASWFPAPSCRGFARNLPSLDWALDQSGQTGMPSDPESPKSLTCGSNGNPTTEQ